MCDKASANARVKPRCLAWRGALFFIRYILRPWEPINILCCLIRKLKQYDPLLGVGCLQTKRIDHGKEFVSRQSTTIGSGSNRLQPTSIYPHFQKLTAGANYLMLLQVRMRTANELVRLP